MTVRSAAVGVAVLGLALLSVALVLVVTPSRSVGSAPAPLASVGALPSTPPRPDPIRSAAPTPPPGPRAVLRLPRLNLEARVVHVKLDGFVMGVPRDPAKVGWWTGGAVPGAATGTAVLVGHVNYAGVTGAFATLPRMRPGDVLALSQPRRAFRVAAVRSYPKSDGLPQSIFRRDGPGRLVLITCGGSFDAHTGNYRDNVVVYATAA